MFRFVTVGLAASLVHWGVVLLLVPLGLHPLIANIFAFLVAFSVSYLGHRKWTFAVESSAHRTTLPRFFSVAVSSFLINESLYFVLLTYTSLDYRLALLLVLGFVAMLTFITSKFWAFSES